MCINNFFLTIYITGNWSLVGEFMLPGNDGTIIFVDRVYKRTAYERSNEYIFCCWFYCVIFFSSLNWCQSINNQLEMNKLYGYDGRGNALFKKEKKKICQCSFALPDRTTSKSVSEKKRAKEIAMQWFWWITESHNLKPQNIEMKKIEREKNFKPRNNSSTKSSVKSTTTQNNGACYVSFDWVCLLF